ncbi:hypothetical protein [Streptomyces sp. N2A]|uniref:hypothetical protein n=1 Tax=Streptomyces sp. N2A TaxID=3073936 RepID=UPI00287023DD|nr:hypothetical protein [Streptomyces sp. N2A]
MVPLRELTTDDTQALTRIYSGVSVRHTTGQDLTLAQAQQKVRTALARAAEPGRGRAARARPPVVMVEVTVRRAELDACQHIGPLRAQTAAVQRSHPELVVEETGARPSVRGWVRSASPRSRRVGVRHAGQLCEDGCAGLELVVDCRPIAAGRDHQG